MHRVFTQLDRLFTFQQGATAFGQLQGAVAFRICAEISVSHQLPEYRLPFGSRQILPDAIGGNGLVAGLQDTFVL